MRKFAAVAALVVAILCGAASQVASADTTARSHHQHKQAAAQQVSTQADTQAVAPAAATPEPITVTVVPGDTLSSIATAHQTTFVRIFDANAQVADPDVIDVGWQLTVPTADQQLPDRYGSFVATQAPVAPVAVSYARPSVTTAAATYPAAPVSDNTAKAFIYSRESGNNPGATNPNGCYGLGQDCNGRVRAQCGADYACQDAYFDNYATQRYGSWSGAEAFWQTHGWW